MHDIQYAARNGLCSSSSSVVRSGWKLASVVEGASAGGSFSITMASRGSSGIIASTRSRTGPTRSSAPTGTSPSCTRTPLTEVPLVLPRSSMRRALRLTCSQAW